MQRKTQKNNKDKFIEDLVAEVENDFAVRRQNRLHLERQWELNMNFVAGNQYCYVNGRGELTGEDQDFSWQENEVFNHIAPIIETRLSKFSRIDPKIYVRPKSDDDKDANSAKAVEKLITETFQKGGVKEAVKKATVWSETCGTGFYKIIWDNEMGDCLGEINGKQVKEGGVKVLALSPFEIFPDNLYSEDIESCFSIIHARAMKVEDIYRKYGVKIAGQSVNVFSLQNGKPFALEEGKGTLSDSAIVIEKYEKPSQEFPSGRLITVAGGKLLYYGELPYLNGEEGKRTFPFVKQESISEPGAFFGRSIIERLIPVQRAFNAVKNRKHEFMNRLSMGILTVEDGSVDVDDLSSEGLQPGKIMVYRQGSKAPEILEEMTMPSDFGDEENKLADEFVRISGVADVSSSSDNASVSSGSALELLIEQDNGRLLMTAENVRNSYIKIARQIVWLFAGYMSSVRAVKYYDGMNKLKVCYVSPENFHYGDVYIENENELLYSDSQKKELLFKLYDSGILLDEEGKLCPATKEKVLALLGHKDLDYQKGISKLQEEKAELENEKMRKEETPIEEIDDDVIHVREHTKYVLSEYQEIKADVKERFYKHIKAHKERIKTGE